MTPADWARSVAVLGPPSLPAWEDEHLRAMGRRMADHVLDHFAAGLSRDDSDTAADPPRGSLPSGSALDGARP